MKCSLKFPLLLFFLLLQTMPLARAGEPLCAQWDARSILTSLPHEAFSEVSGMVFSPNIPGRIYLVNDSGDGPHFYSYDLTSGNYQKITIEGFKGWDIEALSFGPCGNRSCLYVADIGDNRATRKIIRIAAVVEQDRYADSVTPLVHKILTYPDGGKDAEAIAISNKGDLYLFSKEFGVLSSNPTRVYFLPGKKLLSSGTTELKKLGEFRLYGTFMTPLLTVTDAALSPDNSKLILLGYLSSYEIDFQKFLESLNVSKITSFSSYLELDLESFVEQREAVSYSPDGRQIIWTYEAKSSDAPLLQKTCLD